MDLGLKCQNTVPKKEIGGHHDFEQFSLYNHNIFIYLGFPQYLRKAGFTGSKDVSFLYKIIQKS